MTDMREDFERWYTENFGGVEKVFKELRRGNAYPQESMDSVNTAWAAWQAASAGGEVDPWPTLIAIADYLGIDHEAARKAQGKPSDVFIRAIESRTGGEVEAMDYKISACYFPSTGEIEISYEQQFGGRKNCHLTLPVTPEQGASLASVIGPCVYYSASTPAPAAKVPDDEWCDDPYPLNTLENFLDEWGITGQIEKQIARKAWCCAIGSVSPQPSHSQQREEVGVSALVEALELISDTDPDEGTAWFHEIAYKALDTYRKGEKT